MIVAEKTFSLSKTKKSPKKVNSVSHTVVCGPSWNQPMKLVQRLKVSMSDPELKLYKQ